ncbi:MAG: hypothetical protein FJZ47_01555 [Candidatus Tectomicrobia bacterium]|uniref:Uncharacterized protein n=1 Tax=Tectimicrobiota bacterium TaxID=2528274 RepID=A0A938B126_UNCTE|nr:hypothetical protein [Candidatus Tectomicrobia bacterium]
MTKTMVIEPVRAFNGLDVLMALDEGLFAAEGLEVQLARPPVAALTPAAFQLSRIKVKAPEPVVVEDARLEWEWMASWGILHGAFDAAAHINAAVQDAAHTGH